MNISEDELIEALARVAREGSPAVRVGIGDDAAVADIGGSELVLTTDMMVEGVHFLAAKTSARDLGYKSIAASVSDLAAMAASPRFALIGLAMPPATTENWVIELYGGMMEACGEYSLAMVGGDLSRASEILVSVTAAGAVAAGRAVLRSGAKPGHRIVVTGFLGAAAAGLALVRDGDRRAVSSRQGRALIAAYARPVARVGEGQLLASHGASAMIDISDGLAKDLGRMCASSGTGAEVALERLPIAQGLEGVQGVTDPLSLALHGGEDYELLAALPAEAFDAASRDLKESYGVNLSDIGEITAAAGEVVTVGEDGLRTPFNQKGWDHFAD